jgi:hygromycin-B 7''-O-kinase
MEGARRRMPSRVYSERLGAIADEQLQAALDRWDLGRLVAAEPISFGAFGQNVFLTSTSGEYVLRGAPHYPWQFPTERFYVDLLHERTDVPVPWPYRYDPTPDIFAWSYVIMPRMPGLQLGDAEVRARLSEDDQRDMARAMGENLAAMHRLTWPTCGRYDATMDAVQPFDLAREVVFPFPPEANANPGRDLATYADVVLARIRHNLALARKLGPDTTDADAAWVEELIAGNRDALDVAFEPCLVMADYKRDNLVVSHDAWTWRVTGVFDFMQVYFADGEADLSRATAMYLEEEPALARVFVQAYLGAQPARPGFARRYPLYMLDDRLILWVYFHRHGMRYWPAGWTLRDWAGQFTDPSQNVLRGSPGPSDRGGSAAPSVAVGIPITTSNYAAIAITDALHASGDGRHIETAARPYQHPSHMPACCFQPGGDHGAHEIARGKAEVPSLQGAVTDGKAGAIGPAHLAVAVSRRADAKRPYTSYTQVCRRTRAHAGGVEPMGLGQPPLGAVPLGAPTGTHLDWHLDSLEATVQCPPSGIDGSRVFERQPRLGLHLGMPKLSCRHHALGAIAGGARNGKVADAIRALSCFGHHVLDLQRHACRAAVGARAAKLLQQVLAHLVTSQLALLVLYSADFRMFQELGIEAHQLLRDCTSRGQAAEPGYPREHVADA